MGLSDLMGFRVISSSSVPADMVVMVKNGEALHRFVWTANALADQEREIERLRAELAALRAAPDDICDGCGFERRGHNQHAMCSSFKAPAPAPRAESGVCWDCQVGGPVAGPCSKCAPSHEVKKP